MSHLWRVAGALLLHEKELWRCSLLEHRRGKAKAVAFFAGHDRFWSPKFGTLKLDLVQ